MNRSDTRTLGALLAAQARAKGDAPFVLCEQKTVGYAEADRLATSVAQGLGSVGVRHGDRVCLALPNGIDMLASWFGIGRLGAIEVPVNLEFKSAQVRYVVEDSGAEVLIADLAFYAAHQDALEACERLRTVLLIDGPPDAASAGRVALEHFAEVCSRDFNLAAAKPVQPSDALAIMYTSGTTGMPKGVLLCHEHEITLGENIARSIGLTPGDCVYNFFPLHHNTAQGIIACSTLVTGARMLVVDRFSRTRFWPDVVTHQCTVFFGMGAILEMLNKDPDGPRAAQGHRLRAGWGISMGAEQVARFTELFGVPFGTGYGSTEANVVTLTPVGALQEGLVGHSTSDFDVRVVDADDQPQPACTVGEIVVRPARPHVTFLGYWGKPRETVETWRNLWFHTGDAGFFGEDGRLHFMDRIKDVIRYRGNNVSSVEVESVLLDMPAVQEAAVIAAPSPLGGYEQEVRAVLVLAEGARFDPAAVIAHCDERLPYYAVPRYVDAVAGLPKTSTGKVRKAELRGQGLLATTWDRVAAGVALQSRDAHTSKTKKEVNA
ncbi:AMP-binding protein [Hydrogenophaga palleronii]|uniref:AMP-binding protein n=1 Tax=Hydrogenophaga palleronii TaxID=65655 RepID=UPI000825C7CC|nr:AMP-binding protein [Hydrogenophaga palleronii]